jgi:hypothetical protein
MQIVSRHIMLNKCLELKIPDKNAHLIAIGNENKKRRKGKNTNI